jgi:elongation factor Ts
MTITASMVKELRERSGAGMMECKKALVETNGDIEAAIAEMRKKGKAQADKKADRVAAEGIILVKALEDNSRAIMIEINSETDFVARDDTFNTFANNAAEVALNNNILDVDVLSKASLASGQTVEEARQETIAKIGENIKLRRIEMIESTGVVGHYVHGKRIGVLVELNGGDEQLAKDIAMHVAASRPVVVSRDQVSQDLIDKEKEIFTAQAKESGKPQEIIEKMIEGRINKFLDEVSLNGQAFIKDPSTKVQSLLKEKSAEVVRFIRLEVGEGIEKKEDNFVDEVMAQVKDA